MKLSLTKAAALCLAVFPLAGFAAKDPSRKPATVSLEPLHGASEHGTAKLTPLAGAKTKVDIALEGAPKDGAQRAVIALGDCGSTAAKAKYRLKDVKHGKSSTQVPARIDDLVGANLSVQVLGAEGANDDVACGMIASDSRKE